MGIKFNYLPIILDRMPEAAQIGFGRDGSQHQERAGR